LYYIKCSFLDVLITTNQQPWQLRWAESFVRS